MLTEVLCGQLIIRCLAPLWRCLFLLGTLAFVMFLCKFIIHQKALYDFFFMKKYYLEYMEYNSAQIEEKEYVAKLKQDGMRNFIKYGIACFKKDCKVVINK